jgi:hypothetical protein
MDDIEDRPLTTDEIRAQIAEAKRLKDKANLNRDSKKRRAAEKKLRTGRVNPALLTGQAPARDATWTFRGRADLIRQVKELAQDLSEPGSKVSVAALMEEAMTLLIARYRPPAAQKQPPQPPEGQQKP